MKLRVDLFYDENVLTWSKRLLELVGEWPEARNDLRLFLYVAYLVLFTGLEIVTLVQNFDDLEKTLKNVTLSLPTVLIVLKVVMFRWRMHAALPILEAVRRDVRDGLHRTAEEREKVMWYNIASTLFTLSSALSLFFVPMLFYSKPIIGCFIAGFRNCALPYELPARVSPIYAIVGPRDYATLCLCLMPASAMLTVGATGADSLLVSLTFHLCGQLSILAGRLRDLDSPPGDDRLLRPRRRPRPTSEMGELVRRHAELLRLAATLERTFSAIMFVQTVGLILALCVVGYQFLLMAASGQGMNAVHFVLYSCAVVLLAFCYCFLGECLISESSAIDVACYFVNWYELPAAHARPIIMCIARSRKPLYLTAGRFYIFSLETFGGIMKASMAYLSVLRTIA